MQAQAVGQTIPPILDLPPYTTHGWFDAALPGGDAFPGDSVGELASKVWPIVHQYFINSWHNPSCFYTLVTKDPFNDGYVAEMDWGPSGLCGGGLRIYPHKACPAGYSANPNITACIPNSQPIPSKNMGAQPCPVKPTCNGTDPINVTNGNLYEIETDYIGKGRMPLRIKRYYNSQNPAVGMFGSGWRSEYESRLRFNGTSPTLVIAQRPDGRDLYFVPGGGGTWVADADIKETLTQSGSYFYLTTPDNRIESFYGPSFAPTSLRGLLYKIADSDGRSLSLGYGGPLGQLTSVTDEYGRTLTFAYAINSSLVQTATDPSQKNYSYQYDLDAGQMLAQITFPDATTRVYQKQNYTQNTATPRYVLSGIQDESGHQFATWTYDLQGRATSSVHPGAGDLASINYGTNPPTVTRTMGASQTQTQGYVSSVSLGVSRVQAVTGDLCKDCGGYSAASYDTATGFPASTTDFAGNQTLYAYDAFGRETCKLEGIPGGASAAAYRLVLTSYYSYSDSSSGGAVVRFLPSSIKTYEAASGLAGPATCPVAAGAGWTLRKQTDVGYVTGTGRVASRTEKSPADGEADRTTTYAYCGDPGVTASGCVTGLPYQVAGPAPGQLKTFSYYTATGTDGAGNFHTIGDIQWVLDAPLTQATTFNGYDAEGRVLRMTDPNSNATTFTYDARGRLGSTKAPDQANGTRYEYFPTGLVKKITFPNNAALNFTYDDAHRLTDVKDDATPQPDSIHYVLDAAGNRTQETTKDTGSVLRKQIDRVYNALDELTSVTTVGNTTQYAYDVLGRLEKTLDPRDVSGASYTKNVYDARGHNVDIKDPENIAHTLFSYDVTDHLTALTDPNGQTTSYMTNGFGEVRQEISPDKGTSSPGSTGTTTYAHDTGGNLVQTVDPRGVTVNYTYDGLSRLKAISYPTHGNTGVVLTYDAGANGIGRLTSMTDESGTTSYTYDKRGNVASKTFVMVGTTTTNVTRYTWDEADQLLTITYPIGRVVTYVRGGPMGRVSQVTSNLPGQSPTTLISNVTYEPFGPPKTWAYGNGVVMSAGHDLAYRTSTLQHGSVMSRSYGYDAADNVTSIVEGATSTFTYDFLNRLKSESSSLLQGSYTYDAVGNRTTGPAVNSPLALSYSYFPGKPNWLNWVSPTATVTPDSWGFAYDAAGNLGAKVQLAPPQGQTAEQFLIGYGDNNRQQVIQHTSSTGALDYTVTTHNGLGQTVFQYATQGAITNPANRFELFQYDEQGRVLFMSTITSTPNNTPLQEYVYLDGVPVAYYVYDANYNVSGPYFIHGDHLGTPQKVTDGSGAVVVNLQRSAFGMPLATTSSVPPPRLGFPGQLSSFTGWYWFNGFREYDAGLGRYLQADPIGLEGDVNPYAYVEDNPIRFADTNGLTPEGAAIGARIGGIIGAVAGGTIGASGGTLALPGGGTIAGGGLGAAQGAVDGAIIGSLAGDAVSNVYEMAKGGDQNISNEYSRMAIFQPDPCAWLRAQYEQARGARDSLAAKKIQKAQKALGCRKSTKDKCE